MGPRTLLTFDVDGTLIRSVGPRANALHKNAFAAAFREVFATETTIDVIQHHGGTDGLILVKVMEHHGMPAADVMAKMVAAQGVMCTHALNNAGAVGDGVEALPGVPELLRALSARDDVVVALCTGNLQPIGWLKMAALELKSYFTTGSDGEPLGGFGSDFCSGDTSGDMSADRGELVRCARAKAEAAGFEIREHFHIGDTPMDMKAAGLAGTRALGVCTGIFAREQLVPHQGPGGQVLDGLEDTAAALAAFGLA